MDDLGTSALRLERDGFIAWCVLDRPAARNAITPGMYYGIKRAVRLVNADPELRALIITGTGDVFAPGGDLGGRSEEGDTPVPEAAPGSDLLPFTAIRESQAPVIAAVNGICQAGGLAGARALTRYPRRDVRRRAACPRRGRGCPRPPAVGAALRCRRGGPHGVDRARRPS